jgi:hypothetical protein
MPAWPICNVAKICDGRHVPQRSKILYRSGPDLGAGGLREIGAGLPVGDGSSPLFMALKFTDKYMFREISRQAADLLLRKRNIIRFMSHSCRTEPPGLDGKA